MLTVGALLIAANVVSGAHASAWAVMAARDLHAIHDVIRDNAPGPVDPQNPRYRDWLERGLTLSLRAAAKTKTFSDYQRALRLYTNGFEDGHTTVAFQFGPNQEDWPGFVVAGSNDGRLEIVSAQGDSGAKMGETIESCDGRSVDALLKERIDPYFWNHAIPHARMNFAAYLFVVNPDEAGRRLTRCRLSSGDDLVLKWRSIDPKELNQTLTRALTGDAAFAMTNVDGVWFVRLPRFWFQSDEERQKLSGVVAEIGAKAAELRKSTVVFDVRGNGGGDSLWGYRIAAALWGQEWADRIEGSFDSTLDVRVSPANLRKVDEIMERAKKNNESEALPFWTMVADAMHAARAVGRPLARVALPPAVPSDPAPPNPISGRVFLLTDSGCGSACLDFADLVLRLPGVTQIGLPTFADTVYIDANDAELPSGMASVSYGMKVFRHRVRANNQWYEPKYRWPGGPITDDAVAKWIRTLPQE